MSKRLTIDGYGQLELNQVAFRRDGRIEAQCKIDPNLTEDYVENGMLLAVDKAAGLVKYPTGAANELIGLNYSIVSCLALVILRLVIDLPLTALHTTMTIMQVMILQKLLLALPLSMVFLVMMVQFF